MDRKTEFPSDKNEEKEGKYQPSIKPSAEIVSGLVRECLKGAAMVNFINLLSLKTDQKKASQKQVNSSLLSEFGSSIMDKDELGCLYFEKYEIEESCIFYANYRVSNYKSENSKPNFCIDFEDRTIYFLMPSLTNKNSSLIRLNYLHNRRSLVDSTSVTLSLKDLKGAVRLQRSCNRPDVRL